MTGMLASKNWSWFEAISSHFVEEKTLVVYNVPPFENWHYFSALIPEKTKPTMRQNFLVFSFSQIISVQWWLQVGREICLHSRALRNTRRICCPSSWPYCTMFLMLLSFLQHPASKAHGDSRRRSWRWQSSRGALWYSCSVVHPPDGANERSFPTERRAVAMLHTFVL